MRDNPKKVIGFIDQINDTDLTNLNVEVVDVDRQRKIQDYKRKIGDCKRQIQDASIMCKDIMERVNN